MAEILFLLDQHWTQKLDKAVVEANPKWKKANAYGKMQGFIVEIQPDGWFAVPGNEKGRGWWGDKFGLLQIVGWGVQNATLKNLKAVYMYECVTPVKTHNTHREKYLVDVSSLPAPYAWEWSLGKIRNIYQINNPADVLSICTDREATVEVLSRG